MTAARDYLASPQAMGDLRKLNARFIHNFVTNDVPAHDAILHPAFIYISGSGKRVDRGTYLENWATGFDPEELVYWDVRDEFITVIDRVALVRATNMFTERQGATESTGMACYTDTYIYESVDWHGLLHRHLHL